MIHPLATSGPASSLHDTEVPTSTLAEGTVIKLKPCLSQFLIEIDLQAFILRTRVLKLYRQALRIAQRAPSHSRDDLKQAIRQEMENNRHCADKQRIRFLISEGLERLKSLDEMLDMQGHPQ